MSPKASNEREIDLKRHIEPDQQKIAYYHADAMPAPDATEPVRVDRKAALASAAVVETPDQACERARSGRPRPEHYEPTPEIGEPVDGQARTASPYEN